ncbi:MAG: hypothetical protein GXY74_17085 [Phycisphaerae bacterium]|nr:hypothetical protein [Phycisphaerae bacterium]
MIRVRSSTLFKLLSTSIGLLSLVLLGLVGVMVYGSVVEEPVTLEYTPERPKAAAGPAVSVDRSMASWQDRVDPVKEDEPQQFQVDPNAKPSYNGQRFIGWIADPASGDFSVLLQDERTGAQGWWHKGKKRDDIEVMALVGNKVAVSFGGQSVTLVQGETVAKTVRPAARPAGVATTAGAATASTAQIVENPSGAQPTPSASSGTRAPVMSRTVRPTSTNRGAVDPSYWQERLRRAREANQARQNANGQQQ